MMQELFQIEYAFLPLTWNEKRYIHILCHRLYACYHTFGGGN